jgi:uncharacterized protein YceK
MKFLIAGILVLSCFGCGSTSEKNDGSEAMKSKEAPLSYDDAMAKRPKRGGSETPAPETDGDKGK